jgi:alpha-tubulin suppressor-like RCC1 family protein
MVLQGLNYQYSMSSFGLNNHGQLGNGTYNGESSPVSVSDGRPTAIIHCGANFSLVGDFGGIDACGNNDYGQLGSAPNGDQPTPAMIFSGLVAAGRNFTLVVDGVGNLSGCGDNTYGQLGIVTYAPNRVTSLTAITTNVSTVATAPGGLFTLIQTTDGNIHGCGYNLYGQLGNGGTTTTYQLSLTNVTNVQTFAAGSNHSIFIDNLGRILTCGNNSNGQLGNGDATHANKTTPAVVSF